MGFDNDFLDMVQRHRQQKEKNGTLDFLKIKIFWVAKDAINR